MSTSITYNADCLSAMRDMPDNAFDLAIVDPPYGGGGSPRSQNVQVERERERERESRTHRDCAAEARTLRQGNGVGSAEGLRTTISVTRTGGWDRRYRIPEVVFSGPEISVIRTGGIGKKGGWRDYSECGESITHWDFAPPEEFFNELARVSKNQIIWGANYFGLPPTRCFVVWDKKNISETFSMSMCEYAWTSFNGNAKIIRCIPQGMQSEKRIHPTQKPVYLYEKLFQWYAKTGDKILDTHLGSGSSRIAAYNANLDFVGYEIDPVYFRMEEERFQEHTAQFRLF